MDRFGSPAFGTIPQPESFEELLGLACESLPSGGRVRMWRGQADAAWPLHSAAFRRLASGSRQVTEEDLQNYESGLLTHATHRGYRVLNGQQLSDLELLARLQHHGAATRLIDASRSVLVALWFAVSALPQVTGALIGVHSYFLGGYESLPETRSYEELMRSIGEHDHPFTWEPTNVSPRIAAQHSQFLFSRVSQAHAGSLLLEAREGATSVIAISPALKELARELLVETFDIRAVTLFPDIDGFARANAPDIPRWDMHRW